VGTSSTMYPVSGIQYHDARLRMRMSQRYRCGPTAAKCFFFQVSRRLHATAMHYALDEHRVSPYMECQGLGIVAKRDRQHCSPHVVFWCIRAAILLIASSVAAGCNMPALYWTKESVSVAGRCGRPDAWPALAPGVCYPGSRSAARSSEAE
jgi:hypothetical protein